VRFFFFVQIVDMDTPYKPAPESSPELTKKSWFGSLMASEKDETFTILITGKPLSTVKADLIHALLSVSSMKKVFISNVAETIKGKLKIIYNYI